MAIADRYLGDGVYASFDGYRILLDLHGQGTTLIALEPGTLNNLDDYRADLARAAKEQDQCTPPTPNP